jgi:hypothetical protein
MPNHLLVVEGAHDAAFFGKLLARRGFNQIKKLTDVPNDWQPLVPRRYPFTDAGSLDRMVTCPEFWVRTTTGDICGVSVANGDSNLLARVRDGVDLIDGDAFASIGIVLDSDYAVSPADRFASFAETLGPWNDKAVEDRRPGFPLPMLAQPSVMAGANIRFGVHQLPGLAHQGTLETILLECADAMHPVLRAEAARVLDIAHGTYDLDHADLKKARSPAGRGKAECGIIANVLMPGSSLAVSLRDSTWLPENEALVPFVHEAAAFLDALLNA